MRRLLGAPGLQSLGARHAATPKVQFAATVTSWRHGPVVIGSIASHLPVVGTGLGHFGHGHPITRLYVPLTGRFTFSFQGRQQVLQPGNGLVLPGEVPFGYRVPKSAAMLFVDIESDQPPFAATAAVHECCYWPGRPPVLQALGAFAEMGCRRGSVGASRRERREVGMALEALITSLLVAAPPLRPSEADSLSERAWTLMLRRHTDPELTVCQLAEELGVSERTLQRCFALGVTPLQRLTELRVATGQRLLTDPALADLTISEIARRSGFRSPANLRRALLQATGQTPSEIRFDGGLR